MNERNSGMPFRAWCSRLVKPISAVVVVALAATGATAQQQGGQKPAELTLSEALKEIGERSTAAVTAGLDLDSARARTRHANALYLPEVSLSAGHVNRDHEIVAVFGTLNAPTTQRDFFTGELDATELLWDGGRRSSAVKTSQSFETATAMQGKADVRAAQLQGLGTYLQILAAKARRRVVAQRTASLEEHLRLARDLFDQGVVARNDVLETEVRLRTVQDQGSQVDNSEAVGVQALNRLLGRALTDPLALPAALSPPSPLPASLDDLKRHAEDGNQQLLALRARLQAEQATVASRKAENYPTVIAQLSHTYQENRYLYYPNANVLFLGVSWEAYDGGARRASVSEAEIAVEKTQQQITDLQRQLGIQVDQAYRDYLQALKESATAQTNIAASEENLRIEEDQYKAGLVRTTDVLDAESVLAESRFSLVNQHYNTYLKQGVLLTVTGEDLPTFFANVTPKGQEQ
jgi:outer membrane protein